MSQLLDTSFSSTHRVRDVRQSFIVLIGMETPVSSRIAKAPKPMSSTPEWPVKTYASAVTTGIIEGTAASLGECITTQVVRPWARAKYPWRMRVNGDVAPTVSIDARPPGKRATDAEVLGKLADSIQKANAILAAGEQRIDSAAWFAQCGMPLPLVSTARPIVTKPAVALPPSDAAPLMLPPAGTASEGDE